MKQNRKANKTNIETLAYAIKHSGVDIPQQCPTLYRLVDSGDFNLLDLPHLHVDIERILAAISQRMLCLSSYITSESIPPAILRALGLLEPDIANRPTHPCEMQQTDSLMVTANPNKPLSLIISSQRKQSPSPDISNAETKFNNTTHAAASPQSTSGINSPDKNMIAAYDIPNRFWALMEPYCADITEANISFLEGILKSYVEEATTSKYFQTPPISNCNQSLHLLENQHSQSNGGHPTHVPKRLRRDFHKQSQHMELDSSEQQQQSEMSDALKTASEMVTLARYIDLQLKQPVSPATPSSARAGNLLQALEKDLYEKNVSSVLCRAVAHLARENANGPSNQTVCSPICHSDGVKEKDNKVEVEVNECDSLIETIHNGSLPNIVRKSPAKPVSVTQLSSQSLKNLARQLQVSSSFRVEKKVSQAMEELGLFPLTLYLNHRAHWPSSQLYWNNRNQFSGSCTTNTTTTVKPENGVSSHKHGLECDVKTKYEPVSPLHASSRPTVDRVAANESTEEHSNFKTTQVNGNISPSRSLRQTKSHCGRSSHLTSASSVSALKTKKCPASPLVNEFTNTSEEGDGIENGDEEDKHVEQEEERCDSDDDEDDDDEDAFLPPDNTPICRSLSEDFDSVLPNSPELSHRLVPSAAHISITDAVNRVTAGNVKKWLNILQGKAPNLSSEADSLSPRPHTDQIRHQASPSTGKIENYCYGGIAGKHSLNSEMAMASPSIPDQEDDLAGCLLSIAAAERRLLTSTDPTSIAGTTSEVSLALLQRQRELRLICAANHNLLHRLVQASRRDLQRQEIQRRLAIADADVLEAYNKLESYKVQKRTALKRDRDAAWKTLKERQKILSELESFDRKAP